MGRILFFVLLGAAAYLVYRWWCASQRVGQDRSGAGRAGAGEAMVRCAVCGLHLPQSEALSVGAHWYCSDEHRRVAGGG